MFYKYMVFINKETREVELVVDKQELNLHIHELSKNLKKWDWYSVDNLDDIDDLK